MVLLKKSVSWGRWFVKKPAAKDSWHCFKGLAGLRNTLLDYILHRGPLYPHFHTLTDIHTYHTPSALPASIRWPQTNNCDNFFSRLVSRWSFFYDTHLCYSAMHLGGHYFCHDEHKQWQAGTFTTRSSRVFGFFMYFINHCFICRPSASVCGGLNPGLLQCLQSQFWRYNRSG